MKWLCYWSQTRLWEVGKRICCQRRVTALKSLSCFSRVSSRLNGGPHEYWGRNTPFTHPHECKLLTMREDLHITNRLFSTPASLGRANVPP